MIVSKNAKLGALISYIGWPLAALFVLDIVIAVAYVFGGWKWLALPDVPLSIFGGVIGVIAGFRNSSSYARWWEARIIWGSLVNNSRCFARQVLTFVGASQERPESTAELQQIKDRLILLQIVYVHALRNQLRGTPPWPDLAGLMSETEMEFLQSQSNVPLAIHQEIASLLVRCYEQGWIDDIRWSRLDKTLSIVMDCQGGSERIKNTPIPRLYDMFVRVFIDIYCVLLPLGMVASLKLWTPFGSTLVGFMFFALDKIGRDLESPFEDTPHDIALTSISRTIEINLKQMMGEKDVPEPVAPVNGILW